MPPCYKMDLALQLLTAGVSGGVVVKLGEVVADWAGVISGSTSKLREDMEQRIEYLHNRLKSVETRLRDEVYARRKAEDMLLKVLNSHNDMRERNGMERLTIQDIEEDVVSPFDLNIEPMGNDR